MEDGRLVMQEQISAFDRDTIKPLGGGGVLRHSEQHALRPIRYTDLQLPRLLGSRWLEVVMARVRKGMSVEEVREVWLPLAEAKAKAIIDSYYAQRPYSGGREGLGIYGKFQERAAREKVRLAVRLLQQAGLEVTVTMISKVTGQSRSTISNYWAPPRELVEPPPAPTAEEHPPRILRFPGTWPRSRGSEGDV